jgi:Na+/H+-dicarboxylate symporter
MSNKDKLSKKIVFGTLIGIIFGFLIRYNLLNLSFISIDADSFKVLGSLFLNLIKLIAGPLVFFSICSSVISMYRMEHSGKLSIFVIFLFAVFTIFAVIIGILSATFFKPGAGISLNDYHHIVSSNISSVSNVADCNGSAIKMIGNFVVSLVPSNILQSFVNNNFTQIIILGILFAIGIIRISNAESSDRLIKSVSNLSEVCMSVMKVIMQFAPFGIFGITTWLVATQDYELIVSLGKFLGVEFVTGCFIVYVFFGFCLILFVRVNPLHFFKKILPVQMLAFLTSSSTAAMPLAITTLEGKVGTSKEKTSFVLPLATMVNTNGTAMHLAIASIFIAQVFNVEIQMTQYVTLAIITFISSLSTVPVPGASMLMLGGIFSVMNLPLEAIGIIFAIDRISDMIRTVVNMTADMFLVVLVDSKFKTFDRDRYTK